MRMGTQENSPKTETGQSVRRKKTHRIRIMSGLVLLFLLAGICAGAWWYLVLRCEESTDDAYIAGNILRIMPQTGGTVVAVEADNNDRVSAGQPLLRLDSIDARLDYERALVELASAVREVCNLKAQLLASEATVNMRKVELRQETDNLIRRERLARANAIGTEELLHARNSHEKATMSLLEARQRHLALSAMLTGDAVADQPQVRQAAARVGDCWLPLRRTTVFSPADGQIAKRNVQAGEVVAPGTPLMTVIPLDQLWVDANFKEVQLRDMRIGQPAVIQVDMYGDTVTYHGRVSGFSAGTGSAFSLLPPQNATGNWIKIVQRVPVRIEIDTRDLREHPLLIGLSSVVTVDVSDTSGELLARAPRSTLLPAALTSQAPEVDFAPAEEAITTTIRENSLTSPQKETPQDDHASFSTAGSR